MSFSWELFVDDRPAVVMGVVNVTPDSFSDGGRYLDPDAAVAHGLALVAAGADLLDVGGESTRPGAQPVDAHEERSRILPVIRRLVSEAGVPISVDTAKAAVAAAALDAGVQIVNDVSAGRADPGMFGVVAAAGAGFVAMHMQGEPRTMQDHPRYVDVVDEVAAHLVERLDAAHDAGIAPAALAVDPGIGFGKSLAHNLALLASIPELARRTGAPLVIGTSRKAFLGKLLAARVGHGDAGAPPRPVDERDDATLATVVWAVDQGARVVRVHDARVAQRSIRLLDILRRATPDGLGVAA